MGESYYFPCGCLVEITPAGEVIRLEHCDRHARNYPQIPRKD